MAQPANLNIVPSADGMTLTITNKGKRLVCAALFDARSELEDMVEIRSKVNNQTFYKERYDQIRLEDVSYNSAQEVVEALNAVIGVAFRSGGGTSSTTPPSVDLSDYYTKTEVDSADAALQTAIDGETTARTNADTALESKMDVAVGVTISQHTLNGKQLQLRLNKKNLKTGATSDTGIELQVVNSGTNGIMTPTMLAALNGAATAAAALQTAIDGKAAASHTHVKADVTDFAHTHAIADTTGLQTAIDGKAAASHTHVKADVTDFAHAHAIADTTGLQAAIDGKAAASHTHVKADVTDFAHTHAKNDITDFPTTMPPSAHSHVKADVTDFAHTHTIADTTGLQTAIDGKAAASHTHVKNDITDFPTTMPPSAHTHVKADVTDFAHTHAIADTSGLQTAIDGKAAASHTHVKADVTDFAHTHVKNDITDFPTSIPPSAHTHVKADVTDFAHTHAIADTTGLQTAIDGKAAASHTHVKADVTDFAHGHSVDDISGILPVSKGGTGTNLVTTRYAFMAPSTGDGAPTFRPIVSKDVVGLPANETTQKIVATTTTEGTFTTIPLPLPIANGGFGNNDGNLPSPLLTITTFAQFTAIITAMPDLTTKDFIANVSSGVFTGTNAPSGWTWFTIRRHTAVNNFEVIARAWSTSANYILIAGNVTAANATWNKIQSSALTARTFASNIDSTTAVTSDPSFDGSANASLRNAIATTAGNTSNGATLLAAGTNAIKTIVQRLIDNIAFLNSKRDWTQLVYTDIVDIVAGTSGWNGSLPSDWKEIHIKMYPAYKNYEVGIGYDRTFSRTQVAAFTEIPISPLFFMTNSDSSYLWATSQAEALFASFGSVYDTSHNGKLTQTSLSMPVIKYFVAMDINGNWLFNPDPSSIMVYVEYR